MCKQKFRITRNDGLMSLGRCAALLEIAKRGGDEEEDFSVRVNVHKSLDAKTQRMIAQG